MIFFSSVGTLQIFSDVKINFLINMSGNICFVSSELLRVPLTECLSSRNVIIGVFNHTFIRSLPYPNNRTSFLELDSLSVFLPVYLSFNRGK